MPYWVPTLVRRIKIDGELREKMVIALAGANTVSLKLTLAGLLSRATRSTDELKRYGLAELQKIEKDPIPAIGFDLTNYAYRSLFQLLTELAA